MRVRSKKGGVFTAAHTYTEHICEYPPPPPGHIIYLYILLVSEKVRGRGGGGWIVMKMQVNTVTKDTMAIKFMQI